MQYKNRFLFLLCPRSIVVVLTLSFCLCFSPNYSQYREMSKMFEKSRKLTAPHATKRPHPMTIHSDTRVDDYYWLNQREEEEVLDYLRSENEYREAVTVHLKDFEKYLFDEMTGKIKQTDMAVPFYYNGYYYISRYEEGKEYPVYSRKKGDLLADEDILLDVNQLAAPYSYYNISSRTISPDNRLLAYGEDTLSRRLYTLRFKDLTSGEYLEDVIEHTTGVAIWAADNTTVFYTAKDPITLRPYKVMRHILGTPVEEDKVVYEESDETFNVFVYKTKTEEFIVIGAVATLSTEYRILPANNPLGTFKVFQPREQKHEYDITHDGERWLVRTNWEAENFRLMEVPEGHTTKAHWKELIPAHPTQLLEDVEAFRDYLLITRRVDAIEKIQVRPKGQIAPWFIDFGEEVYSAYVGTNPEYNTSIVRLGYNSLTTPNTTYDYDMKSKEMRRLKQQEIVGDFNRDNYESQRLWVTARDGARIPVSIVYRKGWKKEGKHPLLLYGYGSYGHSIDPYFSIARLSLLDRGFAFAIAHIRGGQEMGRQWYEMGKLLQKKNTFYDFIDCADYLVKHQFADQQRLYAMGGSAGGLLMGAVLNMRPELWGGVIAAVPFVDVVTTMLDESIPLTTGEYDEWGNPNEEQYYRYMKSYSPYDQVKEQAYPPLLITTGLHDSQVQYWEPAKWTAKLRDKKTNDAPLLLYCDMETGHGGASGRFKQYKDIAMEYAFLLDLAGEAKE